MSRVRFFLGMVLLSLLVPNFAKAQKIETMVERVKTPVADVAYSDYVKLPIITWGGEYAAVYANGNAAQTTPDSTFGRLGLKFKIALQDDPAKQLEDYLSGQSPFFRGTLDMVNMIAEATQDPRVKPVVFVLLTRSTGGDAVVVTSGINTAGDFKGKKVALQAYGPHAYYAWSLLKSAGLSLKDVNIVWTKDLTGTATTPGSFLQKKQADVAFVIIPDALALSSNGTVGTGAESSAKGARILLSTKTASNVIFDVYAVRSDYFNAHRQEIFKMVQGLLKSQDELDAVMGNKTDPRRKDAIKAFAQVVLGAPQAVSDAEGMYGDCTFARLAGNEKFFVDRNNPRNFQQVTAEIQTALKEYGLLRGTVPLADAGWNFDDFKAGGIREVAEAPRFDEKKVAAVVTQKVAQGTLADGQIFPMYSIFFQPNQTSFSSDLYRTSYDQVISDLSKMGGAVLVIEAHSDPLGYLKAKKDKNPLVVLEQIRQSAKNLSFQRAVQVRQAIMAYASSKGISLDQSQFTVVGHGIDQPKSGMCGADPCAPKDKNAWLENMRSDFRVIQVEAESVEFEKL